MGLYKEVYFGLTYRLESTVHLDDEWMLIDLNVFQYSSLCHYLENLVISFDSILPHDFHCIQLPGNLVSNEQNLREATLTYHFLYKVVVERFFFSVKGSKLLNFCLWDLDSFQLLVLF